MNAAEVLDHSVEAGGHINPNVPPLKEKDIYALDDSIAKDSGKDAAYSIDIEEKETEEHIPDPFVPFDNLPEERSRVITVRAVILGCICGALVNASNVYLGLKTGWTFTANLFGAILGFAVIKFLSKTFAENFPILGGGFGPRENNIVQTAATASGGLSNVFVSAFPALYQLGLMQSPSHDYWRIVSLTAVGGYFGFFFGSPLRKFFVIHVARELRLIFPTASATAMTIRSMHEAVSGELIAKMKTKAMGISFAAALVLRVISQYATGILWDWHIFTWFYIWGDYSNAAINVENWGFGIIEWTPAFIGSGMLVGLNVSWSFYAGSILAWGIIGPALVANGAAFGVQASDDPKWADYVSFASLSLSASNKDTPSPRYWLLWPGVLCMIAVSFTELVVQWKIFVYGGRALWRGCCGGIYAVGKACGKQLGWFQERSVQDQENVVEDPAAPEDQVKMWMWMPGLILSIICICIVMGIEFDMPVGMSLLSVFLAFFFSFLAIQCTGATDITPLTAASKASQIVLGGATKGDGWATAHAQKLNLLGGALANMGANQSTDLTADFRVGFLLRTPPVQQWIAQGVGTIVAIFLAPGMFVLFATAYPCILDTNATSCAFSAPSVSAWRAVAVAVTDPDFPIPTSSGIFAIVFAIIGSALVLIRAYVEVGDRAWMRNYHPNMMCVALAFVLPQTYYGWAMIMGSTLSHFWMKKNARSFDIYGYAIAAGLIAGEGIGGVVNAIFQIAGISGDFYGSNVACPADAC